MEKKKVVNIGIGFATGRKSFKKVLKTNIYNWKECGLTINDNVHLNLLIAYDLKYSKTKMTDYTNINRELLDLVDNIFFIGKSMILQEISYLNNENVINIKEAQQIFNSGYSGQRNAILYFALKNKMDYLIFLDDDEYPLAVTKTRSTALWSGQHVLYTHLNNITGADITHGHHCGYISPIPSIQFNDLLTEKDFRSFIEAISNDIINWDSIKTAMKNGGVTYADTNILTCDETEEVQEINGAKFISGANLCINLTNPKRVNAFYNPPGARGEDTFLSTTLCDKKVLKVPCYTFHDGFGAYNTLLDGVLPIKLKTIQADSEQIISRFYRACIGWIRYKPLLLYITQQENYLNKIDEIKKNLSNILPKICNFFVTDDFTDIMCELEYYHKKVKKHYNEYIEIQSIWRKVTDNIAKLSG